MYQIINTANIENLIAIFFSDRLMIIFILWERSRFLVLCTNDRRRGWSVACSNTRSRCPHITYVLPLGCVLGMGGVSDLY